MVAEKIPARPGARVVYYAARSGGKTIDMDEEGGNPFATSLLELARQDQINLEDLTLRLCELTREKSQGYQVPEFAASGPLPVWTFQPTSRKEKREALVLVVSDYSSSDPVASLMGAAWDERRLSGMLASNRFSVVQGVGPKRRELTRALTSFRRRSSHSDVTCIYCTGHGLELAGEVYLLPGDYPMHLGYGSAQLKTHAITVKQIASAASAAKLNLIFFAGCRTIPRPLRFAEISPNTAARADC